MRKLPRNVLLALVLLPVLALAWTWTFVLVMHARHVAYLRHKGLAPPARSLDAWVRVWWREVKALLLTQAGHARWAWAHRRWVPEGPSREHPVLCVHGFSQNGTNFVRIQRRLLTLGRVSEAVLLGYPPRSIRRYARVLERRLECFVRDFDTPVDVVCHSMGGVVLRVVLHARPDLAARVARVVTIASPHYGTAAGRGLIGFPEVRYIGRRSAELTHLPHLPSLVPHGSVTTLGSEDDTTVYPVETTEEPGAEHVLMKGLGHAGVLVDPRAVDEVMAALERPIPTPAEVVTAC